MISRPKDRTQQQVSTSKFPITRRMSKEKVFKWNEEFIDAVDYIIGSEITTDMSAKFDVISYLSEQIEAPSFQYNTLQELETGKECLLAIWVTLLKHIEEVSVLHYQHICYRIIVSIMHREEFKLKYVKVDDLTNELCLSPEMTHLALVYRHLVRDTFLYVEKVLRNKPSSPEQRSFCSAVVANAFFVYPPVQHLLIDTLSWRYLNYSKDEYKVSATKHDASLERNFIKSNPDLFGWMSLVDEADDNVIPADDTWRYHVSTDASLFIRVLEEVVKLVHFNVSPPIIWNAIPGYVQMIQLFISALRDSLTAIKTSAESPPEERKFVFEMSEYTIDATFDCATKLLINKNLLNVFIHVVMDMVDITNAVSVNKALHYITKWILVCSQKSEQCSNYLRAKSLSCSSKNPIRSLKVPSEYLDMDYIIDHLKSMLESEESSVVVSALTFLYNHMEGMDARSRGNICLFLLQNSFFFLFLHWRFEVRCCFHHILLYRLLRDSRQNLKIPSDRILMTALKAGTLDDPDAKNVKTLFPLQTSKDDNNHEMDPVMCDDDSDHALDLALVSKLEVCLHLMTSREEISNNSSEKYHEEREIFVVTSLTEYAKAVAAYYADEGQNGEAIEAPDLSAVLVKHSPTEL